jgi:hypothetical protein
MQARHGRERRLNSAERGVQVELIPTTLPRPDTEDDVSSMMKMVRRHSPSLFNKEGIKNENTPQPMPQDVAKKSSSLVVDSTDDKDLAQCRSPIRKTYLRLLNSSQTELELITRLQEIANLHAQQEGEASCLPQQTDGQKCEEVTEMAQRGNAFTVQHQTDHGQNGKQITEMVQNGNVPRGEEGTKMAQHGNIDNIEDRSVEERWECPKDETEKQCGLSPECMTDSHVDAVTDTVKAVKSIENLLTLFHKMTLYAKEADEVSLGDSCPKEQKPSLQVEHFMEAEWCHRAFDSALWGGKKPDVHAKGESVATDPCSDGFFCFDAQAAQKIEGAKETELIGDMKEAEVTEVERARKDEGALTSTGELVQRIRRLRLLSHELGLDQIDEQTANAPTQDEKPTEHVQTQEDIDSHKEKEVADGEIVLDATPILEQHKRLIDPCPEQSASDQEQLITNKTITLGKYAMRYLEHIEKKLDDLAPSEVMPDSSPPQEFNKWPCVSTQQGPDLPSTSLPFSEQPNGQPSDPVVTQSTDRLQEAVRFAQSARTKEPLQEAVRFAQSARTKEPLQEAVRFAQSARTKEPLPAFGTRPTPCIAKLQRLEQLSGMREPSLIGTFRDIISMLKTLRGNHDSSSSSSAVTNTDSSTSDLLATLERKGYRPSADLLANLEKRGFGSKMVKFALSTPPTEKRGLQSSLRSPTPHTIIVEALEDSSCLTTDSISEHEVNDLTITQAFDQLDKVVDDLISLMH